VPAAITVFCGGSPQKLHHRENFHKRFFEKSNVTDAACVKGIITPVALGFVRNIGFSMIGVKQEQRDPQGLMLRRLKLDRTRSLAGRDSNWDEI